MSTDRTCNIYLKNDWGEDLTKVTLIHSTSALGEPDLIRVDNFAAGAKSYSVPCHFQTGSAPAYDYWNVNFKDSNGDVWETPNNDRCNCSHDDAGKDIELQLSGHQKKLFVKVDGQCGFEITKN